MTIGILYESKEWSSTALRDYILEEGIEAELLDLEKEFELRDILKHSLLINRVFASSQFRGHTRSLKVIEELFPEIKEEGIEVINPIQAHYYEISKYLTTHKLIKEGIPAPEIYCRFNGSNFPNFKKIKYPCVLKPDCGGRTNYTYILKNKKELENTLNKINDCNFDFILQRFIPPSRGFTTRIEIIDNNCYSIMKRFVTEEGLASYNLGSQYEDYKKCRQEIRDTALKAARILKIEMGSMDIIENGEKYYIIDVNSVSNFEKENIEMFGFNLIKDMAKYIVNRYRNL